MRLGILGGSFDPVHYGHLILADVAREQLQLDQVWLVPAATSPLKPVGAAAGNQARMEMLQLAIGGTPGLVASDVELRRGGVSYTVDTLAQIARENSGSTLFLVVGSDQLPLLSKWHEAKRIAEFATWAFVRRPGSVEIDWQLLAPFTTSEQLAAARQSVLSLASLELSSSELRQRIRDGRSIRFRTPRAVEAYIEAQGLYQSRQGSS